MKENVLKSVCITYILMYVSHLPVVAEVSSRYYVFLLAAAGF